MKNKTMRANGESIVENKEDQNLIYVTFTLSVTDGCNVQRFHVRTTHGHDIVATLPLSSHTEMTSKTKGDNRQIKQQTDVEHTRLRQQRPTIENATFEIIEIDSTSPRSQANTRCEISLRVTDGIANHSFGTHCPHTLPRSSFLRAGPGSHRLRFGKLNTHITLT